LQILKYIAPKGTIIHEKISDFIKVVQAVIWVVMFIID